MRVATRRLRYPADTVLFETAYSWLEAGPAWRRDSEHTWGVSDRTTYFAALSNPVRADVGVFVAGVFSALITLTMRGPTLYEVHLEAKRGTPIEAIMIAAEGIKVTISNLGARHLFAWVPRCNAPVARILKAIGFLPSHVTMWRGERPREWKLYSLEITDGWT